MEQLTTGHITALFVLKAIELLGIVNRIYNTVYMIL